ncbi:MAG: Nramp family divalent metal transporter [Bacteroidetes bacterium]|nr:Nramp family divalent metal transporter [Bacteroidota bacterium]MDA0884986.1 Nramp family divalent metal transporter [Bacteroidota bacterium]MDA1225634.1 Nramp family divalent metal transporter [Bacteroidota bacterium]
MKWTREIGPGILIAAAFIGPGTVTLCTIAGVSYGYSLIWALILSIFATIFLQELSLRVGLVTKMNVAEVISKSVNSIYFKKFLIVLIVSSILIGNAAYEAGNITGASLGISAIIGIDSISYIPVLIGIAAFLILFQGNYKLIEKSLIFLVLTMSVSFLITAIVTKPNLNSLIEGMFIPNFDENSILIVLGLIGTTVVPYNIFLHSSLVTEKWDSIKKLQTARIESFVSIFLGGIVSLSIIVTAASVNSQDVKSVIDLAKGLEPLYGKFAIYFLGIGLFASGITSSITAPLAAAYVAKSCFGWKKSMKTFKFRLVWMIVLIFGVIISMIEINPIEIIKFAQFSNSLLLPIVAIILLWLVNNNSIVGKKYTYKYQNTFGIIIIMITIILGFRGLILIF